jgi:hypothetical protein
MKWYTTKGKLKYSDNWWLVVDAHWSIVNYYKWVVERHIWRKISTPLHGAHITVLAGKHQQPVNKQFWGKYHGEEIEFEYCSVVKTDGNYFWLEARCPELVFIRRELGLQDTPKWPYHLTIGYLNT